MARRACVCVCVCVCACACACVRVGVGGIRHLFTPIPAFAHSPRSPPPPSPQETHPVPHTRAQHQPLRGFFLTEQSLACMFPAFKEVAEAPGPHLAEIDEHTPNSRVFRNYAGRVQE